MTSSIGSAVKTARKSRGLRQEDLSVISGIDKSTISAIENDRHTGSLRILRRCLDVLDLELTVQPKLSRFPDWDDIPRMFDECEPV